MDDKRKKPKSKEVKNKIRSGSKSYHDCCAKVGCKKNSIVKQISKPNTLKSKIPKKTIEKIPKKTKEKRKPFITPEMIDDIKDRDPTNNIFLYNQSTMGRRGSLDKITLLGGEYCDRVKLISKIYKKFKDNDFKIRTYNKEEYPFYNLNEKNPLIDFIQRVGGYKKQIDQIRKDCGEEEANIVNRVYNELIKNKNKIQSRLKKNTPKFLI